MNASSEMLDEQVRENQAEPREQFIRQVSDRALTARQVLEAQRQSLPSETAAIVFIP